MMVDYKTVEMDFNVIMTKLFVCRKTLCITGEYTLSTG